MDDIAIFRCIGIKADGSRCPHTITFKLEYVVDYAREHPDRIIQYTCVDCNLWAIKAVDECTIANLHLETE